MAKGVQFSPQSPQNPNNFSMSTVQLQTSTPATMMTNNVNLPVPFNIECSLLLVDKMLQNDSAFQQLHDLLKITPGYPSISGLQELDYPNLSNIQLTLKSLSQLNMLSTIPFPHAITEQFSHMQQNCELGLLPEIRRAWLIIDNNIYLWAYDNASDVAYYDGLTETIISVGLIKPREGVFKDHIKYLLCLTTAVEILLLGVTFMSEEETDQLLLDPDPIATVPTDNVPLTIITGSDDGRIFLGGRDGCLYEVIYQADEGWFSRKCKKINHSRSSLSFLIPSVFKFGVEDPILQIEIDNSRHILYTRSASGTLEIFDLGYDGKSMFKVATKTLNSIVQQASSVARTIDANNFKPIICINAIEEPESLLINLVAITETGIRLYFTVTNMTSPDQRPSCFNLVHIRLPPGYSASSALQRLNHVHLSLYKRGYSVMVSSQSEGKDTLWSLTNDPFPFETQLMELYTVVPFNGKVWYLVEETKPSLVKQLTQISIGQNNRPIALEPPVIVTEEMEDSRKLIFISSQGIHIQVKPRPVDHLKQLLIDNQGFDNEAVKGFFKLYTEHQACAIALTLACKSTSPQEKQIAEWATLAFFRFGSDPSNPIQQLTTNVTSVSTPIGTRFQHTFSALGSPIEPITTPKHSFMSPNVSNLNQEQNYSNKHNGLYLYFSRIIRPIWGYHIVKSQIANTADGPREYLTSSIPSNEISVYIEKLANLKSFLEKNINLSSSSPKKPIQIDQQLNYTFSHMNQSVTVNTQMIERNSMNNLLFLINRCLEVLGLWRLLYDHQFFTIAAILTADVQYQLKSLAFCDLIVFGQEICALLASALVQKYIEDYATTDAISKRLNDACPTIFKQENALHAKAHEMIIKARDLISNEERVIIINEAVDLFKRIGCKLNLKQAADLLESVYSYKDIVDLTLHLAKIKDEKNLAVYYLKNNQPFDDLAGKTLFEERMECYKVVLNVYEKLLNVSKVVMQSKVSNSSTSVATPSSSNLSSSGKDENVINKPNELTQDQARDMAEKIFQKSIESNDELLHNAFYEWLYEHELNDKLLSIKSQYLEGYFKRKTLLSPDSNKLLDLLWMYYEKIGHFRAAAVILDKLAERQSAQINLFQRLEYLSRAIICMKSCQNNLNRLPVDTTSDIKTSGEFLFELEEKMEVARIQLQIYEIIKTLPESLTTQEALTRLNSDLHDISKLYEEFADRFDLPECQLAILYSAGHYDPVLIENLWRRIFDKEAANIANESPSVKITMLTNKLRHLAKMYISSERFFPLAFIIEYIEYRTQDQGFESNWLIECLMYCGINIATLLNIYHRIYKSKDSSNIWPKKNIQLLQVITSLISLFCDTPNLLAMREQRSFASKCLDVISGYQSDLQVISFSNENAKNVLKLLGNLQSKLDRLS